MSDYMHLKIITAADQPITAHIRQLYIPGYSGETGILENHRPYITLLKPGEIFYTDVMNKDYRFFVLDGFLEMSENNITIIADHIETGDSLLANKDKIEEKLIELDNKIKSFQKIEEGTTQEQILKMPEELEKTLKEQQEYKIRQNIIQKLMIK
jgi:F-type H+-transporting ATPase subunit epsilon